MTETAAWPYDAIEDDPLTPLRIPVTTSHPHRAYLAAFHGIPTPILDDEPLQRPTDAEARMLASYIDYVRQRYRAPWPAKMLAEPLDHDEGHNTHVFHKYGENDWGYRWSTWHSPRFSPPAPQFDPDRLTLVQAMDRARTVLIPDKGWEAWKAARPEVFGDA